MALNIPSLTLATSAPGRLVSTSRRAAAKVVWSTGVHPARVATFPRVGRTRQSGSTMRAMDDMRVVTLYGKPPALIAQLPAAARFQPNSARFQRCYGDFRPPSGHTKGVRNHS